jgi:hypothetical protein
VRRGPGVRSRSVGYTEFLFNSYLQFTRAHVGAAKASVPAFVPAFMKMRGGAWKLEDWSDRRTVSFCWKNASAAWTRRAFAGRPRRS